jgi:glycosyltransferase involved in cell wall biosynthesis
MKILVVQESDWLEKGPHQSHHLMERMSARGHEVRVIDFEIQWKLHEKNGLISKREVFTNVHKAIDEGNITVIRPPIIKLPVMDYMSLLVTHKKEIQKQLDEFQPDVIVGFGILNAHLAIRLAKQRGIPFAYYIIDELHRLIPQKCFQVLGRNVESSNMKQADIVLSINEGLRDYTIQMGAQREKTEVIRAGIDFERFNPDLDGSAVREKLGITEDDIVLFFMGWLYEFSGLKEVALELARNPQRYKNIKLLVLGKGDLWDTLQEIKREHHMKDSIITLDWQPYEEVPKYIAAADICILPAYKNEIMQNIVPIKMYEYMAMGKPVIATRLSGLVKEFGEGNGVIYIEGAEEVLRKTIKVSKSVLAEHGRQAYKFVETNDWGRLTNDFEKSLEIDNLEETVL